jgi:F-type H+-transporting ATPase subunit delta
LAGENTSVSGLAGRYASALFELAEDAKQLDVVAGELRDLKQVIAGSEDFGRLIRSPLYDRDQQGKAMAAILDKAGVSDLTRRFVLVVTQNRRLFALPQMIDAYLASALTETLKKVVGAKVQVDLEVDPELLGGLVVRVGSRMIDSSLRTKLEKLQYAMKGVA